MPIGRVLSRLAEATRGGSGYDGAIDMVAEDTIHGWIRREESPEPVVVDCYVNGICIARAVRADVWREDVQQAGHGSGRHGFRIALPEALAETAEAAELNVELRLAGEGAAVLARRFEGASPARAGAGAPPAKAEPAEAAEARRKGLARKLERLELGLLPGSGRRSPPLKGRSVLDLGCGDGFFCAEAVRQGARRVVGIDGDRESLEIARARVPGAEFHLGSWRNLPEEEFDVILHLSALQSEAEPRRLFSRLADRLTPEGVLILETGHVGDPTSRRWKPVQHEGVVRRYPTYGLLVDDLLRDYAVRHVGRGVNLSGDEVAYRVFHCTPLRPMAMLITAPSGSGKSNFARQLTRQDLPIVSTDGVFSRLLKDPRYRWRPLAGAVAQIVGKAEPDWGAVGRRIAADPKLAAELCDTILGELPLDAPLFIIEGEVLQNRAVLDRLEAELKARAIRVWLSQPL